MEQSYSDLKERTVRYPTDGRLEYFENRDVDHERNCSEHGEPVLKTATDTTVGARMVNKCAAR